MSVAEVGGFIGLLGVAVSLLSVMYVRRQTHTEQRDDAREEALSLAEVRGQMVADLTRRLGELEEQHARDQQEHTEQMAALKRQIETVRQEATETQRLLAVGFKTAMLKVLAHLEGDPPEIDLAVRFLRQTLASDAPPLPMRRRS